MRQVQEMNKHEESALEKKVSLRLGLLLQVFLFFLWNFLFNQISTQATR